MLHHCDAAAAREVGGRDMVVLDHAAAAASSAALFNMPTADAILVRVRGRRDDTDGAVVIPASFFFVHESILCTASPQFRSLCDALSSGDAEIADAPAVLPSRAGLEGDHDPISTLQQRQLLNPRWSRVPAQLQGMTQRDVMLTVSETGRDTTRQLLKLVYAVTDSSVARIARDSKEWEDIAACARLWGVDLARI